MALTHNYTYNNAPRKVDLYIMGQFTPAVSGNNVLTTSMTLGADTGGNVCTGVAKLAQRVVITLLSCGIFHDLDWCNDLSLALTIDNAYWHKVNLHGVVGSSISTVSRLIKSQTAADAPEDEQLDEILITGISIDTATRKISIGLSISTVDQTIIDVVVPISIVP